MELDVENCDRNYCVFCVVTVYSAVMSKSRVRRLCLQVHVVNKLEKYRPTAAVLCGHPPRAAQPESYIVL